MLKSAPIFILKRLVLIFNFSPNYRLTNTALLHKIRTLRSAANILSCKEIVKSIDGVTIPELLWSNLHKWENDKAFDCTLTGRTYTHGEVHRKSKSFSTALLQSGLKRNDVVGILLPNVPECGIVYMGIWDAGLIASPYNPAYLPGEIAKQILMCAVKAVITMSEMVEHVREAQKLCPEWKSIIVIGKPQPDCHSFHEMVKVSSIGTEFLKGSQITNDDIALVPFSSGITGLPKAVMLTHKNVCTNILQLSFPDFHSVSVNEGGDSQERLIGVLPFFHIYGLNIVLTTTLYQGHFTSCLPKFDSQSFINILRKHKPTTLHLVTPLINLMVHISTIRKRETQHVKSVVAGAAPIDLTLIQGLLEKFGDTIFFQEGYGMTEMSPVSHMIRKSAGNTKLRSCGSILPGSLCKIIDKTGNSLGPGEKGEICVKGPQLMKGYFGNEEATKETIDSEGWLHTGDIGYYDQDEYLYIVDRLKELIKVKGLQVAPAELEDVLRNHPMVSDVAVIGVPDARLGEVPRAYVVRTAKQSVCEAELHDYVNKKTAEHKHLKGGIEFVKSIPKSASGKILRRILKAAYAKGQNYY